MSEIPLGRFAWYELLTTDPDEAPDFYREVAGWETAPWDGPGDQPYVMWMNGDGPIGGIMKLPPEAAADGAPPHWLAHISTPDLEATKTRVRELGGQVLTEVEVPEVGRFAVIKDPTGGVVSAYEPAGEAPGHDGAPSVGEFSWHELVTDGWEDAWSFYSQVFGWEETEQMDMGEMGTYHMFGRGTHSLGGMMNRPPEMPMSAWMYYIRVKDLDRSLEAVKRLGGKVLNGPMEVPGGDTIAQCLDPQGAAFAVHATASA